MSSTLGTVRSRSRSRLDFEIFLHLPQYKLLTLHYGFGNTANRSTGGCMTPCPIDCFLVLLAQDLKPI